MILYQRWLATLHSFHSHPALYCANGDILSFDDLAQQLAKRPTIKPKQIFTAYTSSGALAFILDTLQAWRDQAILCPLENEEQNHPDWSQYIFPDWLRHIKLTSGSTGTPRSVWFPAEPLIADAEQIRQAMQLTSNQVNVAAVSMAHSYGFSNLVLPLLLHGQPCLELVDILPQTLSKLRNFDIPLVIPAVPAMWRAWFNAGVLSHLKIQTAISAGSPLPLELEHKVYECTGIKIHNFLGSSECGGIAYDDTTLPRQDAHFVGIAMPYIEVQLTAEQCLQIHGPTVATSYDPQHESFALKNQTFITQDLAELQQRRIYLHGRCSDLMNLSGRKLDPSEVEIALLKLTDVQHCVVFGIPSQNAERCEESVAIVHLNNPISITELRSKLQVHLPHWKIPRHFSFNDELRPDLRGKISRNYWKQHWLVQRKRQI